MDERFTATKNDSQGTRRLLRAKSSFMGAVVTRFPQEYDATGNVTAHGNLLTEYLSIEMNRLQLEAQNVIVIQLQKVMCYFQLHSK